MSFPVEIQYYLAGASVVAALALLGTRKEQRRPVGDVLLVLVTLFVGSFLVHAYTGNKLGKTNASVAAEQSEMQLRIVAMARAIQTTGFHDLAGVLGESGGTGKGGTSQLPEHKKTDIDVQVEHKAVSEAEAALQKAIQQNPKIGLYKAKLAVLLAESNPSSNAGTIADLLKQVAQTEGTDEAAAAVRSLGAVLQGAYVEHKVAADAVQGDARTIESAISAGWYRDHALQQLYSVAGNKRLEAQHQSAVDHKYLSVAVNLLMIIVVIVGASLIGLATIIVQAALSSRDKVALPDEVGLNMSWRTIYSVFIGWFAIEILMSMAYHYLQGSLPSASTQAFGLALSTAITYVLSNLAGPLLIYFLACKPQGLSFWKTLHLTFRTSTAGRPKLVAAGILGWCSAVPLVLTAALLANKLFGVQGSDNPVLGQIMQAASASSIPATLTFYLTLGVLAPFFEEILFRGFIYASLKTKIGSSWAIVSSAALFALMHFDRGGALMLFVIGVVLAFLYERTRSLVPSMICHGMWNSGTFTFALLLFGS